MPALIVSWQWRSIDSLALNVDGNMFLDSNLGGFSGLIRNHTLFCMVSLEKLVDLPFSMLRFWVYTMV